MIATIMLAVSVSCSTGTYPLDIFYEMHYHQSYASHEPPRLSAPADAVPITGKEPKMVLSLEESAELINPLVGADGVRQDVDKGEKLFAINCAMCHGSEGQGDGPVLLTMQDKDRYNYVPKLPPDLRAIPFTADGQIFAIISDRETVFPGVGDWVMPQFDRLLNADERWMLVNYIRSLQNQ